MKKLMAVAVVLGLVAMSSMALAQEPEPRDVSVSGTADGLSTTLDVVAFMPFNIYVVGFGLDGEVKGWEGSLSLPPTFTVLSATLNPTNALNLGDVRNYLVGTGGCFVGDPSYTLVTINCGFFSPTVPTDVSVCIGAASPSSPALGGKPGYLQCDGSLVPFGLAENGQGRYADGCLVLNATMDGPVATEHDSFGELKARF